MNKINFRKRSSITLLLLLIISLFNQGVSTDHASIEKQKGVNLTSWQAEELLTLDSDLAQLRIRSTGANWISLVVTQYQANIGSKAITPTGSTPTDESLEHAIKTAKSLGFKVMLKPHVDLSDDPNHWRAEIGTGFSLADWQEWFTSYRKMILHYANFAQELGVDQFSVGTELEKSTPHAGQWRSIVSEIRNIYSGKLTYSANHSGEEFFLSWWDALDFIGIDAYYPLSVRPNPTLAEIEVAWQQFMLPLRGLYNTWRKPILFTELGYRNVDGALQRPYLWGDDSYPDHNEQAMAYQAFFNQVFWQPWFGGVFWWAWDPQPFTTGYCDLDYTPFDKPAEDVLRAGFGGLPRITLSTPVPDDDKAYRVFTDVLHPDWLDVSWADMNPGSISPDLGKTSSAILDGNRSLELFARPSEALAFHFKDGTLDTRPYGWIELKVQAASANQNWQIRLIDSNQQSVRTLPVNNCRYLPGGSFVALTWQNILVPLDALIGENKEITDIILRNSSAEPAILWIDQVNFLPKE